MYRKLKEDRRGFTLVELIVVIAILGVLMAILVPRYIQYVEKTRSAVCENARGELVHYYDIERASDESTDYAALWKTAAQNTKMTIVSTTVGSLKLSGTCPSDGTYTLTYNSSTGELLSFTCSKHGTGKFSQTLTGGNVASAIGSSLLTALSDKTTKESLGNFTKNNNRAIDSLSTSGGGLTAKMQTILQNSGITIGDHTIWRAYHVGDKYYVYAVDLSDDQYKTAQSYSTTKGTMTTTGSMWMIDTKTNQTTTSDNTSITISQVSNGAKTYAGITNTTS